jgi:diguanylate cyclase (GGDEF)-like protein
VSVAINETELSHGRKPKPALRRRNLGTRIFTLLLILGAVGLDVALLVHLRSGTSGWGAFACFGAAAAITQLLVARSSSSRRAQVSLAVFIVAAALVLPPELVVLVPIAQHVPEWLKQRYAWTVQAASISCATLAAFAAWGTADLVLGGHGLIASPTDKIALAGLLAAVTFVLVDHALVAIVKHQLGGALDGWRSLARLSSLGYNFALAALGVVIALIWAHDSWLALFAIAPLALAQRSLTVPRLQEEARVDPKTGLYNGRHFGRVFGDELARSIRYGHPLSVLMVDLDLLREVNNTYGHLAGDAVLCAVADVFRSQLRHYDVAARFGGEEFSILLPETPSARSTSPPRASRFTQPSRSASLPSPATDPTRTRSFIRPIWPSTAPSCKDVTACRPQAQKRSCSRRLSPVTSKSPLRSPSTRSAPLPRASGVRALARPRTRTSSRSLSASPRSWP